jgi:hypothetical protein
MSWTQGLIYTKRYPSYTWAGDEKPCSITIKEQNLDVAANLYAAPLHLRDRSLERIIWIDAICIDQENMEERGQQVFLLAMIHSKAHCVLVWLGETAGGVKGALEDIHVLPMRGLPSTQTKH